MLYFNLAVFSVTVYFFLFIGLIFGYITEWETSAVAK